MASTINLSDDIKIFYNKTSQISSTDDNVEEPYLVFSFMYNVDGERVEHGIIIGSGHNFNECNSLSLRALIEKSTPLVAMIDLQEEVIRERILNIVASGVNDCIGVEGLKIMQVNVIVELDEVEFPGHRRINLLQKNVYKNFAMAETDNEVCVICLHEMWVGEEVACTPCFHRFHYTCIGRWFERSGFCPLCRFKIDPS